MGDRGLEAIAKALEDNSTLIVLDITISKVTNGAAKAFAKMLETNRGLLSFYIDSRECDFEGAMAIAKAVNKNSQLITLGFPTPLSQSSMYIRTKDSVLNQHKQIEKEMSLEKDRFASLNFYPQTVKIDNLENLIECDFYTRIPQKEKAESLAKELIKYHKEGRLSNFPKELAEDIAKRNKAVLYILVFEKEMSKKEAKGLIREVVDKDRDLKWTKTLTKAEVDEKTEKPKRFAKFKPAKNVGKSASISDLPPEILGEIGKHLGYGAGEGVAVMTTAERDKQRDKAFDSLIEKIQAKETSADDLIDYLKTKEELGYLSSDDLKLAKRAASSYSKEVLDLFDQMIAKKEVQERSGAYVQEAEAEKQKNLNVRNKAREAAIKRMEQQQEHQKEGFVARVSESKNNKRSIEQSMEGKIEVNLAMSERDLSRDKKRKLIELKLMLEDDKVSATEFREFLDKSQHFFQPKDLQEMLDSNELKSKELNSKQTMLSWMLDKLENFKYTEGPYIRDEKEKESENKRKNSFSKKEELKKRAKENEEKSLNK